MAKDKASKEETKSREKEEEAEPSEPKDDSDSEESSDEENEDDLVLEGVIVRNPDVSDSDDTSSEEEVDEKEEESTSRPTKRQRKDDDKGKVASKKQAAKPKKQQPASSEPEIVQVDFTFCDMDEKYFHGLKTLLTAASPIYGAQSSAISDLMIGNISVGTVVSTEGDEDGTVYGFASVLNVTTHQEQKCIQELKKICLEQCPAAHKPELETVLSGKTKRPAGFYLHGRMVNMPLEIVQVLHEQLVLDMDWAVKNAEGGEEERKSLDFGAFVRIAPSYRSSGLSYYKLFDDEIFASHAEFTYELTVPKAFGMEETPYCTVLVMTKTGYRAAMKSIAELVSGGGSAAAASR